MKQYQIKAGECRFNPEYAEGIIVTGYVNIPKGDERALTAAVAHIGPICGL